MSSILTLARTGLFFVCMAGWWLWLHHRWQLPLALAPAVSFCGIGCALYLAALLNVLWPAQLVLYAGGLGLLAHALVKRRWQGAKPLLCPAVAVYALGSGWTLLLLRGALVQGHDNFAHWGIVAKRLISTGHLANTATTAVEYLDYPPASALWIKFFCNLAGTSDGTMLMAQGLLALACGLALGALCSFPAQGLLAGGFCLLVFTLGNGYGTLMVDGLLTLLALAALAGATWSRRAGRPELAALVAAPILGFLAVTKNSGVFLALLTGLAVLALAWQKELPLRRRARDAAAALGLPFGLWYLWGQHIRLVYPNGMESKHAVDAAAYLENLTGKSAEELAQFRQLFLAYWADLSQWENLLYWGAPVLTVLLALALWRMGKLRGRQAAAAAAAAVGGTLLYTAGLAATYIFSMPTAEMLVLASIGRYSLTFSQLVLGGALVLALACGPLARGGWRRWLPALAGLFGCVCLTVAWGDPAPLYSRAYHQQSAQQPWLEFKQQYGLPDGAKYVIYTGDVPVDGWGDLFVARYAFNTDTLYFWMDKDGPLDLDTICYQYEYLLFWGSDEESRQLLTDWGFDPETRWLETRLFLARRDEMLANGVTPPASSLPS